MCAATSVERAGHVPGWMPTVSLLDSTRATIAGRSGTVMTQEIFPRSNKLAAYRLAMRLTQDEVAAGLDRLAVQYDGIGANVTAEMVSRWERGHRRPSRYYRRLFCRFELNRPGLSGDLA